MEYNNLDNSLFKAVLNNNHYQAKNHLDNGADPNMKLKSGSSLLHLAVSNTNIKLTNLLLRFKADPNIKNRGQECRPLHWAARSCHYNLIKTLIKWGADLNVQDIIGNTPLHELFSNYYSLCCVAYLLNHGADPNIKNYHGHSPLHYAIMYGKQASLIPGHLPDYLQYLHKMIDQFNQYGADINLQDDGGYTPLHMTLLYCDDFDLKLDVINTLIQYHADKNIKTNTGKSVIDMLDINPLSITQKQKIIDLINSYT